MPLSHSTISHERKITPSRNHQITTLLSHQKTPLTHQILPSLQTIPIGHQIPSNCQAKPSHQVTPSCQTMSSSREMMMQGVNWHINLP